MITIKCPNCDCVIHYDLYPEAQKTCKLIYVDHAGCLLDPPIEVEGTTHLDRLHSMTAEELANVFKGLCCPWTFDDSKSFRCDPDEQGCFGCWVKWLNQED